MKVQAEQPVQTDWARWASGLTLHSFTHNPACLHLPFSVYLFSVAESPFPGTLCWGVRRWRRQDFIHYCPALFKKEKSSIRASCASPSRSVAWLPAHPFQTAGTWEANRFTRQRRGKDHEVVWLELGIGPNHKGREASMVFRHDS